MAGCCAATLRSELTSKRNEEGAFEFLSWIRGADGSSSYLETNVSAKVPATVSVVTSEASVLFNHPV